MLRKTDLLIITPATTGGSWIFFDGFLKKIDPSLSISICSAQELKIKPSGIRVFHFPMPRYDRYGLLINSKSVFMMAYAFPLLILASFVIMIDRPYLIVSNGFATGYGVLPISRLTKSKLVISHHGYFEGYVPRIIGKLLKKFQSYIKLVVVNSATSEKDVAKIIPRKKLLVVEHWADQQFFLERNRQQLRSRMGLDKKFVIVFVGRIDREKHAHLILETATKQLLKRDFVFIFVGHGELEKMVHEKSKMHSNIRYMGYLSEQEKLAEVLTVADLVWSYADEGYLARPAVEALACGTPLLISEKPAIMRKAEKGIKISDDLVRGIGWLIKTRNPTEDAKFLLKLKNSNLLNDKFRAYCKAYAKQNYSLQNLDSFIQFVSKSLDK